MKVNYVIIFVSNMNFSVGFYKNVIGLPLKFETPEWSEFEVEGATIALHKSETGKSSLKSSDKAVAGSCRPGFSVHNLDEFHKQMIENNVTCFQEPKEVFGAMIAQYLDPDGLVISVSEEGIRS
ncbi:MAG: VOC family protein [Ignavibacteriaceae bacterium]|nr:VOC family protein [Ignavibacteriaceae bacterium]